jgi:hypothetical protein
LRIGGRLVLLRVWDGTVARKVAGKWGRGPGNGVYSGEEWLRAACGNSNIAVAAAVAFMVAV